MRIVAGLAKGRRLAAAPDGTRPTADRTREALFSSLASTIQLAGARVLDLYAGTGAVGLEALSRGAAEAVLVESHRRALDVLRRNVQLVGLPGARVIGQPVAVFVATPPTQPFDLVYIDPPYAHHNAAIDALLSQLSTPQWLAPDAAVVIERAARDPFGTPSSQFVTPAGERHYGDTVLWYGRRR